jgi:hypothetical protein
LSGNPAQGTKATLLSGGTTPSLLIGASGLAIALLLAGYWLFRQRKLSTAAGPIADSSPLAATDGPDEADALIEAILALDDSYQAGKLPEVAYRERRAELKARLAQVMKQG